MEFREKLQELRRREGLTQEALAASLYVSRTAVSKWESGRGYPNLDSLKAIAAYFSVSVDCLLSEDVPLPNPVSSDECPTEPSEEPVAEVAQNASRLRGLVWSISDLCMALTLFLPLFASRVEEGGFRIASLLSLQGYPPYLKITGLSVVTGLILLGALTLTAELVGKPIRIRLPVTLSLCLGGMATVLFIASKQPYGAVFAGVLLSVKTVFLLKTPVTPIVSAT